MTKISRSTAAAAAPLSLRNFGGGANNIDTPILDWDVVNPNTDPPWNDDTPTRFYTLNMAVINGDLQFHLSQIPGTVPSSITGDVRLTVPQLCQISLSLDGHWNWYFRHPLLAVTPGPGMTLNWPAAGPPNTFYYNLEHNVPDEDANTCKEITFYALQRGGISRNIFDAFNLYIFLDQNQIENGKTVQLAIKLDPDIQNPADPDPHIPPIS